jgi:catechol 2,3-dioxygenase-like lactoylglutathione lyase family enzyme
MNDGVTRIDVGDDVWATTVFNNSAKMPVEAMAAVHQMVAPRIEWIRQWGISRHCSVEAIKEWTEPCFALDCYDTIDLAGDELAQRIEVFQPIYRNAKAHGVRLKAHVGEWGMADDVWRVVEVLELQEVQHGIAAAESKKVMRFLAEHQIQLNICPTSNVMLGRVADMKSHPIRQLCDSGVCVTLNSDDILVFGQSVSDEYLNLYNAGVLNASELDDIRTNVLMAGNVLRVSMWERSMSVGVFSVSLTVKDLAASKAFYEKLGFEQIGGEESQNWLILSDGAAAIGLFQGMFEKNMLTFNPGWGSGGAEIDEFEDVRDLQKRLKSFGVDFVSEAEESSSGPASFMILDPDGNPVLVDQHV